MSVSREVLALSNGLLELFYKTRNIDPFPSFIHLSMAQPFVGFWPLLQFRNSFYTDCRTPWTSDRSTTIFYC
jgi:hypothetical protein